ncbi:hypothetical protein [Methylocella sp.]|jgi:hypothetical protein|uniref:hypothetical protein n=1 Tax=Methylocella sp. TaxID=1978226 RepID=UPI003C13C5EC
MALIRPRLTEHYGLDLAQAVVDFAIPFLDEDLPLHVDPFLLWKSPSLQDQALHGIMLSAFNRLGTKLRQGRDAEAVQMLVRLSECDEVGLGLSAARQGKRITQDLAQTILSLFVNVPAYRDKGFTHLEEIQLYVDGISRDRISDFTCNLVKSFLIDFTIEQSQKIGLPLFDCEVPEVYDHQKHEIASLPKVQLPVHPRSGKPILLVPKRWLRHNPWITFDDYFKNYIPKDENHNTVEWDRVRLLNYNRDNYGLVEQYIRLKERSAADCAADPLFKQIPVISAKRKLTEIRKLPTGKDDNSDKKYEAAVVLLLSSMFYPQLDYAGDQVRTDSGAQIRDLIFYMNREIDFLSDIHKDYDVRQLVFELKNVRRIEREHINQINRYMTGEFGRLGVIVTRNPLPRAMRQNTIDLWSGQRRCIIPIIDEDLSLMVDLFETEKRPPIDVLKRSYIQFRRESPV